MNVIIALNALAGILQQATSLNALLTQAQTEGRDLTDAELAQVLSDYQAAHTKLDQDIAAKN
jgi:hypothetical protein